MIPAHVSLSQTDIERLLEADRQARVMLPWWTPADHRNVLDALRLGRTMSQLSKSDFQLVLQ